MAICPNCQQPLLSVTITDVPVVGAANQWNGIVYECPSCHSALSVAIDPVALKTDLLAELFQSLRGE